MDEDSEAPLLDGLVSKARAAHMLATSGPLAAGSTAHALLTFARSNPRWRLALEDEATTIQMLPVTQRASAGAEAEAGAEADELSQEEIDSRRREWEQQATPEVRVAACLIAGIRALESVVSTGPGPQDRSDRSKPMAFAEPLAMWHPDRKYAPQQKDLARVASAQAMTARSEGVTPLVGDGRALSPHVTVRRETNGSRAPQETQVAMATLSNRGGMPS